MSDKNINLTGDNESDRYKTSIKLLERATSKIPMGTQTFSKSSLQFPIGKSPHFLAYGRGGHVWDVDNNKYIDMIAGLLPVLLGYCDNDIDNAIIKQLKRGISFSLATELEIQLAELLVEIIPCAEMVRFGKNGSDVTSAAIRLARAVTGQEHIITCGYHGWHDWYIGTTVRNKGIPEQISLLTHQVAFNDLDALNKLFDIYKGKIAALIMEPMNVTNPDPGYLNEVKEIVHKQGSILIFDEIITGFRMANGGAQELLGIIPDLACFGKAMGNGMPVSAIVGRSDLMRNFDDVFFSGTFGGETLSLAAAIAVINKLKHEPVIETLWKTGNKLKEGIEDLITDYNLAGVIEIQGKAPLQSIIFNDHMNAKKEVIKTLYVSSMLAQGVLTTGNFNIMYAHNNDDISSVLNALKHTFGLLTEELHYPGLEERLGCQLIQPVFSVR